MAKRNQQEAVQFLNKLGIPIKEYELGALGKYGYGPAFERAKYNEKHFDDDSLIDFANEQKALMSGKEQDAA